MDYSYAIVEIILRTIVETIVRTIVETIVRTIVEDIVRTRSGEYRRDYRQSIVRL